MICYLHCSRCGKRVSTGFTPEPTDTPDKGLIVRAWVECPECVEARAKQNELPTMQPTRLDLGL